VFDAELRLADAVSPRRRDASQDVCFFGTTHVTLATQQDLSFFSCVSVKHSCLSRGGHARNFAAMLFAYLSLPLSPRCFLQAPGRPLALDLLPEFFTGHGDRPVYFSVARARLKNFFASIFSTYRDLAPCPCLLAR